MFVFASLAMLWFRFGADAWDRAAFYEVRNDDWNRGAPMVQMSDCIMNANDPTWSDEDLCQKSSGGGLFCARTDKSDTGVLCFFLSP